MLSVRFTPRRYQVKKQAGQIVLAGHPWVYRDHLSTAATTFRVGQWLSLVNASNEVLGFGILDQEGLIGIRVLKRGSNPPDIAWISKNIEKAIARRVSVRGYTDAFRAINGENDNFPGVVVDIYGKIAVLQTYSPAVDTLGRYIVSVIAQRLRLETVVWKMPTKRKAQKKENPFRILRGKMPGLVKFREGKMAMHVEIGSGQKSGTFLDLRGLRKWVSLQELKGKKVLNLFAYTGTLGLAAEHAGASEIWNVDVSQGALDFGKKHHAMDPKKHKWIKADIFEWVKLLPKNETFDMIIVDPPMMAARTTQVPTALNAFKDLYKVLLPHLDRQTGVLLACDCTSRIARKRFHLEMDKTIGGRLQFVKQVDPEDDHPVGFPEGDYLKLLIYGTHGAVKRHIRQK